MLRSRAAECEAIIMSSHPPEKSVTRNEMDPTSPLETKTDEDVLKE
jgi:hypothetical protein